MGRDFRARLRHAHELFSPVDADHVEDAVTALDELVSNPLRHGQVPVQVTVCAVEDGFVLLVTDQAVAHPPRPPSVRDPAKGGTGLGMVALTALAFG